MNKMASACSSATRHRARSSISRGIGVTVSLVSLTFSTVFSIHGASGADDVSAVTKALPKTYHGATVNFPLPSGPAPEAYIKVSKEFEDATGIQVNFTILSYQELHQKLILDLTSGSNSFDALMFAYQWKREIDPYMAD